MKHSQTKLTASLKEKEFLLKEIHHRVKNNLALVSALLELQELTNRTNTPNIASLQSSRSRIKSMALAHEALYQNENFSSLSMQDFVPRIANLTHRSFAPKDDSIKLECRLEEATLSMKRSISLGLLINEIMVNAYKHAFKGKEHGTIKIESSSSSGRVTLSIRDDGVGFSDDTDKSQTNSLGMKLIRRLAKQLFAEIDITSSSKGTVYTLNFEER